MSKQSRSRVDPHIKQLAVFAYTKQLTPPCEHILAALAEIDRKFPELSFKHFLDALNVAELLRETGGHA